MPTIEQRKQERALALTVWLDSFIIVPYAIVAIWVGSLAMLSEVLRGGLLLIVTGFSLRTLRRTHRGLIADYEYGIGKLERAPCPARWQFCSCWRRDSLSGALSSWSLQRRPRVF